MVKKSAFRTHVDEAEKATDAAETFVKLAEKNPIKRVDLLRAGMICMNKAKMQIEIARLYKK